MEVGGLRVKKSSVCVLQSAQKYDFKVNGIRPDRLKEKSKKS